MEKHLETLLVKKIKAKGGLAIKLYSIAFTGLPDRLILLPGARIDFIETKYKAGRLRPRQGIVKGILEGLGFTVRVVGNVEDLNKYLETIND